MDKREKPGAGENTNPPQRKRNAAERFLSELLQQAASIDMAPAHDAPLAKQLRRNLRAGQPDQSNFAPPAAAPRQVRPSRARMHERARHAWRPDKTGHSGHRPSRACA